VKVVLQSLVQGWVQTIDSRFRAVNHGPVVGEDSWGYNPVVTKKDLIEGALHLPPSERAEIAREIIASLDAAPEEGVQEAWLREIQRRAQEAQGGSVPLSDWGDVQKRIAKRLASRA
jgi:putative addiction module component (TIGR02574 family)